MYFVIGGPLDASGVATGMQGLNLGLGSTVGENGLAVTVESWNNGYIWDPAFERLSSLGGYFVHSYQRIFNLSFVRFVLFGVSYT